MHLSACDHKASGDGVRQVEDEHHLNVLHRGELLSHVLLPLLPSAVRVHSRLGDIFLAGGCFHIILVESNVRLSALYSLSAAVGGDSPQLRVDLLSSTG